MPDDCGVHVDDALCYEVAHQYSMIGIARRQTNNLRMRRIGIETFLCFKWIVDNPKRVQFLGYLAQDCANIHFRKAPAWPQAKAAQTTHFAQLMNLSRVKGLKPIDRQTCLVRSGGA